MWGRLILLCVLDPGRPVSAASGRRPHDVEEYRLARGIARSLRATQHFEPDDLRHRNPLEDVLERLALRAGLPPIDQDIARSARQSAPILIDLSDRETRDSLHHIECGPWRESLEECGVVMDDRFGRRCIGRRPECNQE